MNRGCYYTGQFQLRPSGPGWVAGTFYKRSCNLLGPVQHISYSLLVVAHLISKVQHRASVTWCVWAPWWTWIIHTLLREEGWQSVIEISLSDNTAWMRCLTRLPFVLLGWSEEVVCLVYNDKWLRTSCIKAWGPDARPELIVCLKVDISALQNGRWNGSKAHTGWL